MAEEGKFLGYMHVLILFKVILKLETKKQWRGEILCLYFHRWFYLKGSLQSLSVTAGGSQESRFNFSSLRLAEAFALFDVWGW